MDWASTSPIKTIGWVKFRPYCPEHLDYRSAGIANVPDPYARFESKKVQFNQNEYDESGCTYTAGMTITANNWLIVWTAEDIKWFLDNKHLYGWTGEGMYMDRACDMVCYRLNMRYPAAAWKRIMIDYYVDRKYYLSKWHMIMIWSIINTAYIQEIKDGSINAPWWKTGMWHVRSDFEHIAYVGEGVVENFLGQLPFNVIDIVAEKELDAAWQRYHSAFIIYPSGKMDKDLVFPVWHKLAGQKIPYMTVEQAEALEAQANKVLPGLLTQDFSESVRKRVDEARSWNIKYGSLVYNGIDGVMKMMIDIRINLINPAL